MVIFPPDTTSLMVNVKALVFKPSLKKKKCLKSQGSIKIPVLTQKDNFSSISRKGNLQNLQFYDPPAPTPSSALQMRWRQQMGGGGGIRLLMFVLPL